jgi:hypothetical protein
LENLILKSEILFSFLTGPGPLTQPVAHLPKTRIAAEPHRQSPLSLVRPACQGKNSPIPRAHALFRQPAAGNDSGPRRAKDLRSGRLRPPHPSPLLRPPFEGTWCSLLCHRRSLPRCPAAITCWPLHRDAWAEQRADRLRPDSHVSTTMLVQPLPAWFPLSMAPQSHTAWRMPLHVASAAEPRCHVTQTKHVKRTPLRVVPSACTPRAAGCCRPTPLSACRP